jgi:hypothetical protein
MSLYFCDPPKRVFRICVNPGRMFKIISIVLKEYDGKKN